MQLSLDEAAFKRWCQRHLRPNDNYSVEDALSEWIGGLHKGSATLFNAGNQVFVHVDVEQKDDDEQDDAFERSVPSWAAKAFRGGAALSTYMGW